MEQNYYRAIEHLPNTRTIVQVAKVTSVQFPEQGRMIELLLCSIPIQFCGLLDHSKYVHTTNKRLTKECGWTKTREGCNMIAYRSGHITSQACPYYLTPDGAIPF